MILQYLKLVRIPNLLMLALAQILLRYAIMQPILSAIGVELHQTTLDFVLLVLSTLLIAAGGYIINDFYDIRIDRYNKAGKVILFEKIPLRRALYIYYALTAAGCLCGIWIAFHIGFFFLGFLHILIALSLYFYSRKYKRKVFVGNLTVALLSALTIIVVWLFEWFALQQNGASLIVVIRTQTHLALLSMVFAYAGFAFFVNLIRELIKDIEDREGDARFACKTLPIRWGMRLARKWIFVVALLNVLLAAAGIWGLLSFGKNLAAGYSASVLGGLWVYFIIVFFKAKTKKEYCRLSLVLKIIILAGLLSMPFIFWF